MARSKFSITALIGVDSSKMKRGLARAAGRMRSWAKSTMATIARVVAAGVAAAVAALAAFGVKSVKEFASFEQGMLEVFTLLPGISKQAMGEMSDDVLKLANKMGVLPEEVVPALYQALSAGVPPGNVFDFLEVAVKGAKAGVATTAEAVDLLTSVVNAYGSANITASEASDIIFTTIKAGKTTFSELAAAIYNVGPAAAQAGVSFQDVSSALAAMTAQGVPTKVATTQIRQAILALTAPNATLVKGLGRIGVTTEQLAAIMKEPGGLLKALELVKKAAAGDTSEFKTMMGSVEALQAAFVITADGGKKFTEIMGQMANSAGATNAAYDVMTTSLKHQFAKVLVALKIAMIGMGKALRPFVEAAVPAVQKIIGMIGKIPWTAITQGFARVWLIGIKPYFDAIVKMLGNLPWGNLIEYLLPIASMVIKTIQNIGGAIIRLGPSIIPGIQALAGYFGWLMGKFYLLSAALFKFAPEIAQIFRAIFQSLAAAFNFIIDPSKEKFAVLIKFIKSRFSHLGGSLGAFMTKLKEQLLVVFGHIWNGLKFGFGMALDFLKAKLKKFLGESSPELQAAAAKLVETWKEVRDSLGPLIDQVIEAFKKMFGTMSSGQAGTAQVGRVVGYLKETFGEIAVAVIEFVVAMMKMYALLAQFAALVLTEVAPAIGQALPGALKVVGAVLFALLEGVKFLLRAVTVVVNMLLKLEPVLSGLAQHTGKVGMTATRVATAVINALGSLYHYIKKMAGESAEVFVTNVNRLYSIIRARLGQFRAAWSKVFEFIAPIARAAFDKVQGHIDSLQAVWGRAFKFIKKIATTFMKPVLDVFDALKRKVYEVLFGGTVTKDFARAFKYISELATRVIDGMLAAFNRMGGAVKGIFGGVFKLAQKALKFAGKIAKGAGGAFGGILGKLGGGGSGAGAKVSTSGAGVSVASLNTALKPIVQKLTSMDITLKSIDRTLKGKFVNQ